MMQVGVYTLLITPFKKDLSLDEEGLRLLVNRQIEAEVHGIAPLGVTGENNLLTDEEVLKVVKIIVDESKGKVKIVPDTCTTSYWKTEERIKAYTDLGVDYISIFSPHFILPKEDGIIKYYEKLADISKVPLILHNSKGRTGIELTPEITSKLAKHPNIVGIKDGNKQLDHLAKVVHLTKDDEFEVFTGKDTTAFPFASFGGKGSFTVAGNVVPGVMKNMIELTLERKLEEANNIHLKYYPLFEALRFETNPMAAKMALNLMGLPAGSLRLPLTELSESKTNILKSILEELGLI